jgi:hypothetical protein
MINEMSDLHDGVEAVALSTVDIQMLHTREKNLSGVNFIKVGRTA